MYALGSLFSTLLYFDNKVCLCSSHSISAALSLHFLNIPAYANWGLATPLQFPTPSYFVNKDEEERDPGSIIGNEVPHFQCRHS